ncbi:hypothetical protein J0H58_28295 [bacterium]|nr:hypothetical protein [bacterium]
MMQQENDPADVTGKVEQLGAILGRMAGEAIKMAAVGAVLTGSDLVVEYTPVYAADGKSVTGTRCKVAVTLPAS